MDWLLVAKNDWDVYQDKNRIKMFVLKEKITKEQYQEVTGDPYGA